MEEIMRPQVPIGKCITLTTASRRMGMSSEALRYHKNTAGDSFPSVVAQFGRHRLYVYEEVLSFYQAVMWRQADRHIKELTEGGDAA